MSKNSDGSNAPPPPNDWLISDQDQEWFDILQAIEEGRSPDHAVLAKHLRNPKFVVDQPVLDYLADHLEGKKRRSRGRPRSQETIEKITQEVIVRLEYGQAQSAARKIPKLKRSRSTPSEIALLETVRILKKKGIHLSPGAVKKIVFSKRVSRRQHSI